MSRDIQDLDPDVRDLCTALLTAASQQGIVLGVTQTYRTFAEQASIYAQGRTTTGPIVTHSPPGFSWHNWRKAFDVDILSFPGDMTPGGVWDGPWETVGALGESLGLEWGGRWKHVDLPHFELRPAQTLVQLIALHPHGLS